MKNLSAILEKIRSRTTKGSSNFYKALPTDESRIVRAYYLSLLDISPKGHPTLEFFTPFETRIARGYERVEIMVLTLNLTRTRSTLASILVDKFKGTPSRHVKYIWMEPNDGSGVKVYRQQDTVSYADYRPGFYYIAPDEIGYL